MCTTLVTTSHWGPARLEITRADPCREPKAWPSARTRLREHDEVMTSERLIADEVTADETTAEEASRLAVMALAADLEYWARTVSVGDQVGLNDLFRVLDLAREASIPAA
jgi:hypothetical protein